MATEEFRVQIHFPDGTSEWTTFSSKPEVGQRTGPRGSYRITKVHARNRDDEGIVYEVTVSGPEIVGGN